ncbi:MAG: hypothetical protein ACKVE4_02880 [Dissulfuribacterales bacterium]
MSIDKKLEYIKLLNSLSEIFGESEGQSPDEIREELKNEGFDINSAEVELIKFQQNISMAAKRQALDEAKNKREKLSVIKQQMLDKVKNWTRDQVVERLKHILSVEPDTVVAYRNLNSKEDEDIKAILIDLELAMLITEEDSNA